MVDFKLTADAVRFRRIQVGKIAYFENVNNQARRYRYDINSSLLTIGCNNFAIELISDSLESYHDECHFRHDKYSNSSKLFLVFTLPLVEEFGTINTYYVWGCAYLPILGEIHSVWLMPKGKDIINNYDGFKEENTIDLSDYIDYEKVISFEMEDRDRPIKGARFSEQGIKHVAPEISNIIKKVESIIININYDRVNVTIEDLKQIIEENLERKQESTNKNRKAVII